MAECNGLCVTGADVGVPEYGDQIAYPHPSCPVHGDGLKDSDFINEPAWSAKKEALWQAYCDMRTEDALEVYLERMADQGHYWGEGEWSNG